MTASEKQEHRDTISRSVIQIYGAPALNIALSRRLLVTRLLPFRSTLGVSLRPPRHQAAKDAFVVLRSDSPCGYDNYGM